jgi:PAS domain S-box-containing protein
VSRSEDVAPQLASSEEGLRSIIEAIPDGVVVVDEQGTIELFNPAFEGLFGYPASQMIGRNLAALMPPEIACDFADNLRSHVEAGEPAALEVEGLHENGMRFPLRLNVGEARLGDRRLFACSVDDLGASPDAPADRGSGAEWLELALAAGDLGVWEWDVDQGVVRWSESLERIHGLEPGSFDGTLEGFSRDIVESDRPQVLAAIETALEQDEPYAVAYRIRRPDGEQRWLATRGTVVRDLQERPSRMLGVCTDVTGRKLAEQRFEERFAQLGAIYRMTEAVGRAETEEQIYENALDGLEDAVSVARASVLVADPDGAMRFKAWRGLSDAYRAAVEGHAPWDADDPSPRPLQINDVENDDSVEWLLPVLRDEGIRALAFLPLFVNERLIGELVLSFDAVHSLSEDDMRLAQVIASTIAVAIDRRRGEAERTRLLDQERVARETAEQARSRVARLQSLTTALSDLTSVEAVATVLVREGVDAVGASAGVVFLAGEQGELLELVAQSGYGDEFVERLDRVPVTASTGAARAFRLGQPLWYRSAADYSVSHPDLADFYGTLGYEATAFLPLASAEATLGVFAVSFEGERRFEPDEREHLTALSGQCAQAFERARLFQREHEIAETLQRSILPRAVPPVDGVAIATSYLPGTGHAHVGGDWYDVIVLEASRRVAFVVGDVEGKGIAAAAAMAQLRFAVQGFASQELTPAATLRQLNRLLDRTDVATFATVVYAELDPETGVLVYANAGHPPPLVVDRDGAGTFLEGASSLPLGADPKTPYAEAAHRLEPGFALVLYTDGLVERRTADLGERLERLRAVAGRPDSAAAVRDRLLAELVDPGDRSDDIALVVAVRLKGG